MCQTVNILILIVKQSMFWEFKRLRGGVPDFIQENLLLRTSKSGWKREISRIIFWKKKIREGFILSKCFINLRFWIVWKLLYNIK